MIRILRALVLITTFSQCSEKSSLSLNNGKEANMRVNYYLQNCIGEMDGQCLLIQEGDQIGGDQWVLFYYYNSIEGFDYESGYVYDLIIEKKSIKNPPQDASGISYKLIKIVSKTEMK